MAGPLTPPVKGRAGQGWGPFNRDRWGGVWLILCIRVLQNLPRGVGGTTRLWGGGAGCRRQPGLLGIPAAALHPVPAPRQRPHGNQVQGAGLFPTQRLSGSLGLSSKERG